MPNRPQPRFPEPNTQPFWEGAKQGQLLYQQCNTCAGVVFYPRMICTHCGGLDLAWKQSKGEVLEYACHEGNYSLPGMLAGARADEAAGR